MGRACDGTDAARAEPARPACPAARHAPAICAALLLVWFDRSVKYTTLWMLLGVAGVRQGSADCAQAWRRRAAGEGWLRPPDCAGCGRCVASAIRNIKAGACHMLASLCRSLLYYWSFVLPHRALLDRPSVTPDHAKRAPGDRSHSVRCIEGAVCVSCAPCTPQKAWPLPASAP